MQTGVLFDVVWIVYFAVCFSCLFTFDRLIRSLYLRHPDKWVEYGRPSTLMPGQVPRSYNPFVSIRSSTASNLIGFQIAFGSRILDLDPAMSASVRVHRALALGHLVNWLTLIYMTYLAVGMPSTR